MIIIKDIVKMQKIALGLKRRGKSLGFVPTMGALHDGHASLIKRAVKENDVTVVSIFVNPAQFGPNEDYLLYLRPFNNDKKICINLGVDYIFIPTAEEMYPKDYLTFVNVNKMTEVLCGGFRPGHFKGVATIVSKLFNIVQPDKAYFGLKDYQQLKVIERMAKDLNFPVKIVPCPIIREKSGLALSSRNTYLSKEEKLSSLKIQESLKLAEEMIKGGIKDTGKVLNNVTANIKKIPGSKIDYIKIVHPDSLEYLKTIKLPAVIAVAAWVGKTRLIDNIIINKGKAK
jgi:pantoate--beta-alanine ligase